MTERAQYLVSTATFRGVVAGGLIVSAGLGVAVIAAGIAPWGFLAALLVTVIATLVPRIGWIAAFACAVSGVLLLAQWTLMLAPLFGRLDLSLVVVIVLMIASAVSVLVAITSPGRIDGRVPIPRVSTGDALAAVAPASLSAALLLVGRIVHGRTVTWAMAGDAQFNTVLARLIADDGGATQANSTIVSLVQGLMAMSYLPGRGAVPQADLLAHDIARQSDLWLLLVLLGSIAGGALAAQALRRVSAFIRLPAVVISATVPLTWHLTGYALTAGFYNVSLAYLGLVLTLLLWTSARQRPLLQVAAMGAVSTVMLGAWTPLVVVPGALMLTSLALALARRDHRLSDIAITAISLAQVMAFGIAFILPSFLSSRGALSQDGTIVNLPRDLVIALAGVLVVLGIALLFRRSTTQTPDERSWGLLLLVFSAASAVGTGYLVWQNRGLGESWIYYPIKFAWIGMEVAIVLTITSAALLLAQASMPRFVASVAVVGVAASMLFVMKLNPPRYGGGLNYAPLVQIAARVPPEESALPFLSSVANEKVIFTRFLGDNDQFMNQWLFQLTVRSADEPIRSFAYRRVETQVDICDAAEAWGGGVRVITRDASWARELDSFCGDQLVAVVMDPRRT